MAKKQKYYVVWVGKTPGIYLSWSECEAQITGFPGARFKGFDSLKEAETAFDSTFIPSPAKEKKKSGKSVKGTSPAPDSLSVDAACSGNPGAMEYQGVHTATGRRLFHQGPFPRGTNNIGEFLAIVHALAYLHQHQKPNMIIYSDSVTAMGWVQQKKARTLLEKGKDNAHLFELIQRAEQWLLHHPVTNPIIKWETTIWGENPADFGRK